MTDKVVLKERIEAWIKSNSSDKAKVLEIEAVVDRFTIELLKFIDLHYTKIADKYDFRDTPYCIYNGKDEKCLLENYKYHINKLNKNNLCSKFVSDDKQLSAKFCKHCGREEYIH
jgi:hypothetical protein